jgi:hypothetical protein
VAREKILDGFRAQWVRLLTAVAAKSGADLFRGAHGEDWSQSPDRVQAIAVVAEKSVAGYLAKYLGKGSGRQPPPGANFFYPSRWWGVSRPLGDEIAARTEEVEVRLGGPSNRRSAWEDMAQRIFTNSAVAYEYTNRVGPGRTIAAYGIELRPSEITDAIEVNYSVTYKQKLPTVRAREGLLEAATLMGEVALAEASTKALFPASFVAELNVIMPLIVELPDGNNEKDYLHLYTLLWEVYNTLLQPSATACPGWFGRHRRHWVAGYLSTRRSLRPVVHAYLIKLRNEGVLQDAEGALNYGQRYQ